jgi:hypothetical protein
MLLCLFLFDDAALRRIMPAFVQRRAEQRRPQPGRLAAVCAAALALVTVPVAVDRLWQPLMRSDLPLASELSETVAPLLIVNSYGLFASMTTSRPVIILEGSDDGTTWRDYEFRYLPGPLARPLRWCIPYQPRLDWQIWVAGYGSPAESLWFAGLVQALLRGSPAVLDLLAANPFPEHAPKYVRAELYDERFADPETHARSGQWWSRRLEGLYFPSASLADFARTPQGPSD